MNALAPGIRGTALSSWRAGPGALPKHQQGGIGMATYKFRFFFDNIAGVCLWAGDTATMERFNYPVFLDMLPIPSDLIETGDSLIERWEQHVYEERPWPPGNSLAVFARDCRAFVCRLESALPDGYEIADEHTAKLMRVAEAIEDVPLARGLTPPSM